MNTERAGPSKACGQHPSKCVPPLLLPALQALASLCISIELLPAIYRQAAHGYRVCLGADCYRASFLTLAVLDAFALGSALLLERRNRESLPVAR